MSDLHTPGQNRLLAALPVAEYERLFPHLEQVELSFGDVLYQPGGELRHAYFPTTAVVSVLYVTEDGVSAEIAVVGNEGILGVALFTGGDTMPNVAMVQCPGHAYRLKSQLLKDEFYRSGALQDLLLRYTQVLITQASQNAVCNRHHSVEQQLCRWLLLRLDNSPLNELTVTQEFIASALGVRREAVTVTAGKLRDAGLIDCRRGCIAVLSRP
ncbi:MAG TPA: Crp/Fnr family transcriptional regulator, partial [Candidatus Competibacteraceae bacterium]|nr:Crp/Fnr family transcriptional regulator [Candidatus Competibacteraceae bacterium]